jgi:hypothetical protein
MSFVLKNVNIIKNYKSKNILSGNKIFDWNNTVCPLAFRIIMKNLKENNDILSLNEIKKWYVLGKSWKIWLAYRSH